MFDIAWTELLIIAIVAILVVGPRELPAMLRGIGKFMGQMRRMAGDFQRQFNDALKETELDEVRRDLDSIRRANPVNRIKDELNPLKGAGDSMRKAIEDPGAPRPKTDSSAPTKTPAAQKSGAKTPVTAPAAKTRPAAQKKTQAKPKPPAKTATASRKPAASPVRKTKASPSSTAKRRTKPAAKAEADGGGASG